MQFKIKKSLIISLFIAILAFQNNLYSSSTIQNIDDFGIISLMYHRFEENKYPSTNIKMDDFKEHLKIIKENKISFINPKNFEEELKGNKSQRKILLTIDDGFLSFYNNAWPILKEKKIPFILFVSTREVGSFNYMKWDQIKEISKEDFVEIGNHSHTHEYLLEFKEIIKSFGFKYAFGQHSGVIDETKDFYELPRFPINEKYGEIKRFNSLTKTLPFQYKKILPEEKYLLQNKNPPEVKIEFYDNIKNLESLGCYSNEGGKWRQSDINFTNPSTLQININDKFIGERGRINCSLKHASGFWRWLGIQFVISDK